MRARLLVPATLSLAGCSQGTPLNPPTPAFLENPGRNHGGTWEAGCPPDPAHEALSPDLIERLTRQFPRGSEARRLEAMLVANGFRIRERTCATVPSIRLAEFQQTGGGFYGPHPALAQIVWDQDADGRLLWIKALVSYTGP